MYVNHTNQLLQIIIMGKYYHICYHPLHTGENKHLANKKTGLETNWDDED